MTTDYETRQQRRASERQAPATDLSTLKRHHARIFGDLFRDFRNRREEWDKTVDRDPKGATVIIPTSDGSPPVVIMSPEPRKALTDHVSIITLNDARLDAVSFDPRETARREVEDIRLYSAMSLARKNEGKRLQIAIAYPMLRYGVAALWAPWQMPPTPDREELSEYEGKDTEAKRLAFYEDWHRNNQCTDWELISPLQVGWFPLHKPQIIIQDSIIPYESLTELEDWEGRKGGLDGDKNVVFGQGVGSSEDHLNDTELPEVHFIRRAMETEPGEWWVTEWCAAGKSGELKGHELDGAKLVRQYRCPYNHAPYIIIPGGGEDPNQTNPHKRYWPHHLNPLIVYTDELNALTSLVVQLGTERAKTPNYIRIAGITEAAAVQLNDLLNPFGMSATIEGTGADRAGVIRSIEVNNQEMPVLPDVQPIPDNVEPALLARIEWLQTIGIPGVQPNRWLTGQQEARALQQGTLGLNQMQAASTPYMRDVTAVAEGIETLLQMELEAIGYWDKESRKDRHKVYAIRAYSDAPVLARPPSDGDAVKLTPDKLRHPYKLIVHVDSDTAQDRALKEQSAQAKYAGGWLTKAKALKEMGEADPERAIEEIEKERMYERQRQLFQPVIDQQVSRLVLALTGISVSPEQMGMGAEPGVEDIERQQANQGPSVPQPATTAAPLGVPEASTTGAVL